MVKLWLDDIRDPEVFGQHGWYWVRTSAEAIHAFRQYDVVEASLDHDLGPDDDGYTVACWLEEEGIWPIFGVRVHSANPVGRERMLQALESARRRHYAEYP